MEPVSLGFISIIVLFVFILLLKVPVGFAMALAGAMGIYAISGVKPLVNLISHTPYSTSSTYIFTVIPMFVLMGWFIAESEISRDLFIAARRWVGWIRGGLAMAVCGACAILSAVLGESITGAVTMTSVALPEMRRYNYSDRLSTGILCAGGNLGFLIPPSIAFIIYGVMTETSIGHLFIAGILPGIFLALLFMMAIYIICRVDPKAGPATPRVPVREALKIPMGAWITLLIIIVVLGGIYGGLATPTEAGGFGAFAALIFGLASRRLNWSRFVSALSKTIRTSGMIFILIIGAMIFSAMLALSTIPFMIMDTITGLAINPMLVIIFILILYIILGFFFDIMSILLILLPITGPIVVGLGFDPVWMGVLTVITVLIGQLTPPFGIVVYAVSGVVKDVPMMTIFRGAVPFVVAMLIGLIVLIIFPDISLFLPHMMRPGG